MVHCHKRIPKKPPECPYKPTNMQELEQHTIKTSNTYSVCVFLKKTINMQISEKQIQNKMH